MPCSITVVFALGPQEKSIQPSILPNRIEPVPTTGKKLMDIPLMAHVENQLVFWGIENPVQRNCQLYHTQVRTEVPTGLRENRNQFIPYLLCELGKASLFQTLEVRRRIDSVQQPGS